MPPFLFTLGLILVGSATVYAVLARRRQVGSVRSLTRDLRLNYSAEDLIGLHERYYALNLIRQGHHRQVSHILYGVIEEGLVSLFCYRYDIGFGVSQAGRQWWMAVVETQQPRAAWMAYPNGGKADLGAPYPHVRNVAGFTVCAETTDDPGSTGPADIEAVLRDAPPDGRIEVRQRLVAVALPFKPDGETPRQVLTVVRRLARRMTGQEEHK